jgi:hypothetical protein
MKYVLLFCGTAEDAAAFDAMTPDELRQRYGEVGHWFQEHAAKILYSDQLQPSITATTVRHSWSGGEPVVTDGPFVMTPPAKIGSFSEERLFAPTAASQATAQVSPCGHLSLLAPDGPIRAIYADLLTAVGQQELARAAELRALELTHNPAEQSLPRRRLLPVS